jgi:hypothetical protein
MERQYAPYPKWFGTAFAGLACASKLGRHLEAAVHARDLRAREEALVPAYEAVAAMHNELGLTDPLPSKVKQFFGRPFRVIAIHGFSAALLETIESGWLSGVLRRSPIGGIDLISDNTDFLEDSSIRMGLGELYRSLSDRPPQDRL